MVPIGQCDILIRTEVERQTMHSEVIGSAYGILVAGVPVGEPQYEYEQMRVIGDRYTWAMLTPPWTSSVTSPTI